MQYDHDVGAAPRGPRSASTSSPRAPAPGAFPACRWSAWWCRPTGENEEAVAFFQHRFKRMGVDTALEKAGARDGDEVRILGFSFAFESPTAGAVDVYRSWISDE